MSIPHIMQACLDLADYIDRSGAASSRFLRHVAACLRFVPRRHPARGQADLLSEAILAGKALPAELRAFADCLAALEAA